MTHASIAQWSRTTRGDHSEGIKLIYHDEFAGEAYWGHLEDIREDVHRDGGQFISLDLAEPQGESLPELLHAALKSACWEQSLPLSLPVILRHNPRANSLFINRAILWQRLCDLLFAENDPRRETVLVLERVDQAPPKIQHEIVRLIRFHKTHSLHRSFVFTLNYFLDDQIIPELRNILGM